MTVTHLGDDGEEKRYWLSRTIAERLNAIECNRKMIYGIHRTSSRLHRLLEIISLDDLKLNKRAAGRHKDLEDIEHIP